MKAEAVKPLSDVNGVDRTDENIAHVDAIPTGSPDSGTQSDAGEPGGELPALGRHTLGRSAPLGKREYP